MVTEFGIWPIVLKGHFKGKSSLCGVKQKLSLPGSVIFVTKIKTKTRIIGLH